MVHIPGARHKAVDAISRHPTGSTTPEMMTLPDDIATIDASNSPHPANAALASLRTREPPEESCSYGIDKELVSSATSTLNTMAVTWETVKLETTSDPNLHSLTAIIESGFPEAQYDLAPALQEYHRFRHDLHTIDGVILYKDRIVIPPTLREVILKALHSAHQGVTSMTARAESSVFWPGITPAIVALRERCSYCNRITPSQPSAPPYPPILPAYPFQCICADFFHYKGSTYLVAVDRYSNWPIVEKARDGSAGLVECLRRTFCTFGIPDECASDGGPEFVANPTQQFLKEWGVHHRLSSVAFPHSNSRAEIGVKTVKRLITNNTGPHGELNTNAFQQAILQYRNTPDPSTKLLPAQCIFGRPIKDSIPILPGHYIPHPTWRDTLALREEALRNRHMRAAERWSQHTKRLPPLAIGHHVRIQNQTGPNPTRWDKTGIVIEVRQFDQYVVRVDGSGRITLRNRKFLRKYIPVQAPQPPRILNDDLKFISRATQARPKESLTKLPKGTATTSPTGISVETPTRPSPPLTRDTGPGTGTTGSDTPTRPPETEPGSAEASEPVSPAKPPFNPPLEKKIPLALRRLQDYNKKGLLEQ
ncbi:uncharacterized protein K02A2.6-like [Nematostella vectensis]|uniref:uncharacterized protein K02A2.6-like n=1 Tax=Nematostella vectensis TaxID=45351 RepID=UPI0020772FB8|nr:uncharacterized protein K02A2.6-like [Nematostella vectensis]